MSKLVNEYLEAYDKHAASVTRLAAVKNELNEAYYRLSMLGAEVQKTYGSGLEDRIIPCCGRAIVLHNVNCSIDVMSTVTST